MSTEIDFQNTTLRTLAKTGNGAKLVEAALTPVRWVTPIVVAIKRLDQGARAVGGRQLAPIVNTLDDALKWAPRCPPFDILATAANAIRDALCEPLPDAATHVMIASLLAGSGTKPPENPAPYIAALVKAVDKASDPLAHAMDWWPTIPREVSPAVLAHGIELLGSTNIFKIKPAEMRQACVESYRELAIVQRTLHDFAEARAKIDDMIRASGKSAPGVPAVAAPIALAMPIEIPGKFRPGGAEIDAAL
jgi:hypothetical protein